MSRKLFPGQKFILHGGDYNPDQWLDYPQIIDDDFRFMDMAHCQSFSVGIFAWSALEPEEGKFEFGWLDQIMDRCAATGKKVFLATPTGARPPWMAKKYPACRRVDIKGNREFYQMRHNLCFSAPETLQKVRIIDEKIAQRYGHHPALLGWHISNELSGECYCEHCLGKFYTYLQKKYHTIEELNKRVWSSFWSHKFTSFDEIDPRDPTLDALRVDWKHFCSLQMADFLAFEKSIIRQYSDAPVTTNMMGLHPDIDYYEIAKHCDFISDDCYPMWYRGEELDVAVRYSMLHDLHYAMQDKPFVMMESAPGIPNYRPYAHLRRPGEFQREMLLAIGHGADGTMYFQWRKGRGGFEKFHGAVVGHDNSPDNRFFKMVADYGEQLEKLSGVIGSIKKIDVALLWDWDNMWSFDAEVMHNFKNVRDVAMYTHYRALWDNDYTIGVYASTDKSWMSAKLVVAPMLSLLHDEVLTRLIDYVTAGGTLIVTHQFGTLNGDTLCRDPRDIEKLCGLTVEEDIDCFEPARKQSIMLDGKRLEVTGVAELLHLTTAEAIAKYESDFYAGFPAIARNTLGKGEVWYIGANLDRKDLRELYGKIASGKSIKPALPGVAEVVKASRRYGDDGNYLFLCNFSETPQEVALPEKMVDLLSGNEVTHLILPGNGSTVLKN